MSPPRPGMKGKCCYQVNSCLNFCIHAGHGEMSSGGPPKTPKQIYKSVGSKVLNCCRLCKSFGDVSHWKNLALVWSALQQLHSVLTGNKGFGMDENNFMLGIF